MSQVQSVERTLSILELLAEYPEGLRISEITAQMNLAKSTIHRLLQTLVSRGYVHQNSENGHYQLGTQCLVLASSLLNHMDIRTLAKDALQALAKRSEEVVHLCIHDKNEVVYIDKVESNQTLRMYSQIGRRAYMHCTGVGKAILSDFSEAEIDELVEEKGLPVFTNNTITTKEALKQELRTIKQQGYAIDEEEHENGIRCIAAPVFDHEGKVVAAISIAGPVERVTKNRVNGELASEILKQSKYISNKLGHIKQ
ncbi:IclR family transcriptional regulator [Gracilibacillus massiliensis]|uniref:IclR family transcriptional regulator n=1 Tax=Gracilibacillus massiliensis TaxID=1564956 RepID=UPI00071D9402|nr:IclR family transcriptional regulator [Gracilibacillus massiliensis]